MSRQSAFTHDMSGQRSLAPVAVVEGLEVVTRRRFLADLLARSLGDCNLANSRVPVLVIDGSLSTSDPEVAEVVAQTRTENRSVVAICTPPAPIVAARWLELGVSAVLTEDATADDLLDVVERLVRGETVLGVAVREGLLSQLRAERQLQVDREALFLSLTRREREVLQQLAIGASPEDVARTSFVSLNTIRTQIRGILAKLEVSSVVAAVAMAYRSGWITVDRRKS